MTEWRPIPGVERYEVSPKGEVRHRTNKKPLSFHESKKGYLCFYYRKPGEYLRRRKCYVHVAVALAFLPRPDPPYEYMTVDHIDGNRWNNILANLRWADRATQRSNQRHWSHYCGSDRYV